MRIEVFTLAWNDPTTMRTFCGHYSGIADRIYVWDRGCTDETLDVAESFPLVKVCGRGDAAIQLDHKTNAAFKQTCWQDSTADWVVIPDTDEWLVPLQHSSVRDYLASLPPDKEIVRPTGINVLGEDGQDVAIGARKWRGRFDPIYSKPCMFRPQTGAIDHVGLFCHTIHMKGQRKGSIPTTKAFPVLVDDAPLLLLHGRWLGTPEVRAARAVAWEKVRLGKSLDRTYPLTPEGALEQEQSRNRMAVPLSIIMEAHRGYIQCGRDLNATVKFLNSVHQGAVSGRWTIELLQKICGLPQNAREFFI